MDCSAVLLSRQLREMCESSLISLRTLFEQLSEPNRCAMSCIFIIDLKLRKKARKDLTTDSNEPVEVCLQPDLDTVRSSLSLSLSLSQSIRQLVASSRPPTFQQWIKHPAPTQAATNGLKWDALERN
jgi:hypothetical protein